jgi:hypothetical protein
MPSLVKRISISEPARLRFHVVKARLFLSGVAERECLCGCARGPQGEHRSPITALQTTDTHMYLVPTNVAQLAHVPRYIRVSKDFCHVEQPGLKQQRMRSNHECCAR